MTTRFNNRNDNLTHAVLSASQGVALEFGVYSGRTLRIIRELHDGPVVGFDSFKGLPERWRDGWDQGHFAKDEAPVIPGTIVVVGRFEETLDEVLQAIDRHISFVHIDCDIYSSTAFVLDRITPYLASRSTFVFDEYWNYAEWEDHEHRAFKEWQAKNPNFFAEMRSYVPSHQQATFEITRN
jgi:radical SAM superfamily enzyme YgiQ (UPF0313 family)